MDIEKMKQLEFQTDGDVAWNAYSMCEHGYASADWARKLGAKL